MPDVTLQSKLQLVDGAKVHAMFDEAIIHLPESSEAVTVNSSALAVLITCDGATPLEQVAALIADDLGIEAATITEDVLGAAQEMTRLGVLAPARN
ncbi:MAG: PqqD family protein [Armatimonadetes bacterium]|nr:PqqD family protein [Armatimonadota bacterium]